MCRHIAWLGEPRTLAALILDPPHSLLRQSYAPRRQRYGTVNADGFGVGWYAPSIRAEPARYRRCVPLWNDTSFASFAGVVTSATVLAAVRSATVGMPVEDSAAAPFTDGSVLFSHNGRVARARLWPLLAGAVEPPESITDSAMLATLLWARRNEGTDLSGALSELVCTVVTQDPHARMNLLATDGTTIAATTWGDTLSYRTGTEGIFVASEPTDDSPGWVDVPDRCLLRATAAGVTVCPLSVEVSA
jgi:glutamine amidotransferase